MHDLIVVVSIFSSLYTVSVARELLRQKKACSHCKASLIAACGAAIGEACYTFSGETILYFIMR